MRNNALDGVSLELWDAAHPNPPIESDESWAAAMERKFPGYQAEIAALEAAAWAPRPQYGHAAGLLAAVKKDTP